MPKKTYQIKAKIWLYPGMSGWHFLTIPKDISEEIDYFFGSVKKGWGSLPVQVTLGQTVWKTSVFTDKKTATYLLPLKAEVRKKENVSAGDEVTFSITINES